MLVLVQKNNKTSLNKRIYKDLLFAVLLLVTIFVVFTFAGHKNVAKAATAPKYVISIPETIDLGRYNNTDSQDFQVKADTFNESPNMTIKVNLGSNFNAFEARGTINTSAKISYKIEKVKSDNSLQQINVNDEICAFTMASHDPVNFKITPTSWPNFDDDTNYAGQMIFTISGEYNGAIKKISSGAYHTLALTNSGDVWAWGYGGVGRLGNGDTTEQDLPVRVKISSSTFLTNIVDISASEDASYAVDSDGNVWGWGDEIYGNLVSNSSYAKKIAIKDSSESAVKIKQISAYHYSAMALAENGDVYSWGWNGYWQCGRDAGATQDVPKKIVFKTDADDTVDHKMKFISMGYYAGAAIDTENHLWTWGSDDEGQFGSGENLGMHNLPGLHTAKDANGQEREFKDVAMSRYHCLAIDTTGQVYAWGYNHYGVLGIGNNDSNYYRIPQATAITNGSKVTVYDYNSMVITKDMKVYTAGGNNYSECGHNYESVRVNSFTKVQDYRDTNNVKDFDYVISGACMRNSCVILADDNVFTSGFTGSGQIGNGTSDDRIHIFTKWTRPAI